nr:FAD-dependent oxidoreductase [Phytohabitans aurantiacus]
MPGDIGRSSGLPWTGKGIVVGFVDWGLDVQHAALRHSGGGGTRVEALWLQGSSGPGAPSSYGYGRVFDASDIDAALREDDPYAMLGYHPADFDAGLGAHGTHTTGIACGNGIGGGQPGFASDAAIVFVNPGRHDRIAPLGSSVELLEALDFIVRKAAGRACVINLSLGRHAGEHTGRSLVERAMDHLVSAVPGRAIVQSCGNYAERRTHTSWRMRPGGEHSFRLDIDPNDLTLNELDLWYPGVDRITVRLSTSDRKYSLTVPPGEHGSISIDGREAARVYHRVGDPQNGDCQVSAYLEPTPTVSRWVVTLTADDIVDGRMHGWIERDGACRGCQTRFTEADADPRTTLGSIANGRRTFVVAAYDSHHADRPPARFSSSGPTRDGRGVPLIAAPGVLVLGPRSRPRGSTPGPAYVRMSGTSMAAPAVTATVAMLFEAAGRKLSIEETRLAVLASCDPPAENADRDRLGNGYLNPVAATRRLATGFGTSVASEVADASYAHLPVAVVGGGFAGLAAAWHLTRTGFPVTVFEASGRLGGRVRTDADLVPGKVLEAGAELIGDNHPTWHRLAATFGLHLQPLGRSGPARTRLGNHFLTPKQVADAERQITRVQTLIGREAQAVPFDQPWTAPDAAGLDALSVADRLSRPDMFGRTGTIARRLFDLVAANDQCAPVAEQSYLGLLAAVRAHTIDGNVRGYWTRTETRRCKGGNEQLATHLAKSLPDVRLNTPVSSIEIHSDGARLTYEGDGVCTSAPFAYVVLALPPAVWPSIHSNPPFTPADFTIRHGPAVKFIGAFTSNHWGSPNVLWDQVGSVWEGTDNQRQPKNGFALSTYSGDGLVLDAAHYPHRLEEIFPGYRKRLTARLFADWPNERWIGTGYANPALGQVTTVLRNLSRPYQGRLFFAGEQTSPGFFGYMEGALQSGNRAAELITAAACDPHRPPYAPTEGEDVVRGPAGLITGPTSDSEHLTPAQLFDAFAAGTGQIPGPIAATLSLVAGPRATRLPALRPGDLMLTRGRGSPFAAVAVVATPTLRVREALTPAGYVVDSPLPGRYVHVMAMGPHRQARRVTDPVGVVLDHVMILRPQAPQELSTEDAQTQERWTSTEAQVRFREAVLDAHIARQARRRGSPGRDLGPEELAPVAGTEISMRRDAAQAAGRMLAAANTALTAAHAAGDADAGHTVRVTASSGYRDRSHQTRLWRKYFTSYYDDTRQARDALPGGPHSDAAVGYLLEVFRIPARIAAPGYSNHQNGIAIDLMQERTKGHGIRNSTAAPAVQAWRTTWLYRWLRANAASFGYSPYEREPWHWEHRPAES